MKIISWNVNGLRAISKKEGKMVGWQWLIGQKADIFCLQETKSESHQLPSEIRSPAGYYSYFNSSKGRKGYSGVVIYTKVEPQKVEYGFGIPEMDQEGRLVIAYFDDFVLLNCYFPNGGGGPERLAYKLKFYGHFLDFVQNLRKKKMHVIFCGDINTAHEAIDLARPKENEKNTGFLPIEREWITQAISAGFVDMWRTMYPALPDVYTYWDMKTFARSRNVGWRIDYFFVDMDFAKEIKKVETHTDVLGSDHCPLSITL